jgi:hypothetical protein
MSGVDGPKGGLDKTRSDALRREVMGENGEPLVAVVEVSLPYPELEPVTLGSSGDVRKSRFQLVGPEPDPEEVSRRITDVQHSIGGNHRQAARKLYCIIGEFCDQGEWRTAPARC